MLGFRRRGAGGRHGLGAAVTGIPSAPRRADVGATLTAVSPPLPVPLPVPRPAAPTASTAPPSPTSAGRVELGFRDGTCAALEPGSEQARALQELAGLLSGRGAPSGVKPRDVPADTD